MSPKIFDKAGWLSGSTRVISVAPPPPPPPPPPPSGNLRTMIGSWSLQGAPTLLGDPPSPDTVIADQSPSSLAGVGGWLDDAVTGGWCMITRATKGNAGLRNADGTFSTTLWKAQFDVWKNGIQAISGGETKLRAAVAAGRYRGMLTLDDFSGTIGANAFARAVTYTEFENICAHVKVTRGWDWLPLIARGRTSYLRSTAISGTTVRQYAYLDAGWSQWRAQTDGPPGPYFDSEIAAGDDCGLADVSGANLLDGGAGTTAGWGCQVANEANKCGMSPAEVRACGFAAMARPRLAGHLWWDYNHGITYWSLAAIQAALTDVYNASLGRDDGPINIRDDLGTP